jgi:DNA mismatch repair protein MutS
MDNHPDNHPDSINELSMFEQYRYYYDYYHKKYKKLAVLMQVGDFYEIYGVDNETTKICNVKEMLKLLPLALQESSKPHYNTEKNPLKAGFPKAAKSKYINFLVDGNDYIVVQVDETGPRKNSRNSKNRAVTAIHSPGTYIQEGGIDDSEHRYLVQIVVEGYKDTSYTPMSIGLSAIDIETGEMDFYEVYNDPEDENYALDEVWRYLSVHGPREVLVVYKDINIDLATKIKREITTQVNIVELGREYEKLNIQTKFLEKVFPSAGKNVLEWLEITKFMTARLALISMLSYVINHNRLLSSNLKKPSLWFSDKYLLLANNAIMQLDLVSSNRDKYSSVFNLVNFTSTNMGKRLLKHRLLNPLKDPTEIKARYKMVDNFSNYESYETFLNGITDLEKFHRKIELGILSPAQLAVLYGSYVKVERLVEISPPLFSDDFPKKLKKYIKIIKKSVDLERCGRFNSVDGINEPIFTDSYAPEFKELSDSIKRGRKDLNSILEFVSSHIPSTKRTFDNWMSSSKKKPDFNFKKAMVTLEDDKVGYYLKITKNRLNMFKKLIAKYNFNFEYEELGSTPSKSHFYITTKRIRKIGDKLKLAISEIKDSVGTTYLNFLKELEGWQDVYKEITKFVSLVDVYKSCAKCAKKYNYVKPKVKSSENSYIVAEKMRHPLAERLCTAIYVPHDVDLGRQEKGMLVYGVNASGKSCYMKAVGVNLILAQAGLFVPADKFYFSPYDNVLTRILGNDDMQAGLSSFAVEMIELRGILARMGSKSLILGDELCKGTETVSGPAIVAESVIELIKKGTNFVFATHLHNLVDLKQIKELDNLGVYHIKVKREGKKLIYDRTIEEGPGDSLYGLEVARAMGLPDKFVDGANKIRKDILGIEDSVLGKVSRYSQMVYLLECGVCGNPSVSTLETHHIVEQEKADENGFVGHYHKNHPRNLVGLCKKCHKDHHKGKIAIKGWEETSDGFRLLFKIKNKKN